MKRVGIDVGGTNTDAVLLDGERVVAAVKTPTTADVTSGITRALADLLAAAPTAARVDAVMIGTTHFTNAVVQRRGLTRIAAVRIGLPASASLPPFVDWPDDLAELVRGEVVMLEGGHEYDGRPIVPFDAAGMRAAARRFREAGVTSVAVASVFSPLDPSCEEQAAAILAEECPDTAVTLSHRLGRIGLLERENVTLLNACLLDLARKTARAFIDALRASGIVAPLYLTQNDGTVMLAEVAEQYPVYSFASGPTNSMRGAAFLSRLADALVVDVGGTTTDVGALRHGFPREENNVVEVYRLTTESRVFGGTTLTATDVGVAAGLLDLGDRQRVADLPGPLVRRAVQRIGAIVEEAVDRVKTEAGDVPLVVVGGGAFLVPERLAGVSSVVGVEHQAVANAVGAAIAQVSGEVDQIFQALPREEAIARASRIAADRAVTAGAARDTLRTVEVEDLPLAYLPGNSLRVRVRVVGEIAAGGP